VIFCLSIIFTINNQTNKFIFTSATTIVLAVVSYLLILTSNIINGSLYMQLPLEQAGKASQFIFGLISTYVMLIYLFSTGFELWVKLLVILPGIFYFTY